MHGVQVLLTGQAGRYEERAGGLFHCLKCRVRCMASCSVSVDVLYVIHDDCAMGISPITSHSGVKSEVLLGGKNSRRCGTLVVRNRAMFHFPLVNSRRFHSHQYDSAGKHLLQPTLGV